MCKFKSDCFQFVILTIFQSCKKIIAQSSIIMRKWALKDKLLFAIHRKRIFHALKNMMMQHPFNSNTLSDDRYDSLDFISWEKIFLDQTLTFDLWRPFTRDLLLRLMDPLVVKCHKWSLNQFLVLLFAIRIIMKSDISTPVYINTETVRMFSFVCQHSYRWSISWHGMYINRLTPNRTKVSVEKIPIFCEVTYYNLPKSQHDYLCSSFSFATKSEIIFRILIRYFRDQFMII